MWKRCIIMHKAPCRTIVQNCIEIIQKTSHLQKVKLPRLKNIFTVKRGTSTFEIKWLQGTSWTNSTSRELVLESYSSNLMWSTVHLFKVYKFKLDHSTAVRPFTRRDHRPHHVSLILIKSHWILMQVNFIDLAERVLITWQARAICLELHQTLGGKLHWRLDWTSKQQRQNARDSNAHFPNTEYIVLRLHSTPAWSKSTFLLLCDLI